MHCIVWFLLFGQIICVQPILDHFVDKDNLLKSNNLLSKLIVDLGNCYDSIFIELKDDIKIQLQIESLNKIVTKFTETAQEYINELNSTDELIRKRQIGVTEDDIFNKLMSIRSKIQTNKWFVEYIASVIENNLDKIKYLSLDTKNNEEIIDLVQVFKKMTKNNLFIKEIETLVEEINELINLSESNETETFMTALDYFDREDDSTFDSNKRPHKKSKKN